MLDFGAGSSVETQASPGVRRVVLAKAGASFALLAIEGQGSAAVRQRLYAFTERPLYRPGQEVNLKAILRSVEDGENRVVKGVAELPYTILDPEDTKVAEGKAKLLNAETGTYGATVQLPGEGRLGLFRVVFQGPQGPAQAEFKVEHFVKPAFAVAVSTGQGQGGPGRCHCPSPSRRATSTAPRCAVPRRTGSSTRWRPGRAPAGTGARRTKAPPRSSWRAASWTWMRRARRSRTRSRLPRKACGAWW